MIYVMSDIHGYYNNFIKMLKVIDFKDEDTLYILGDIIDRGPDIVKVVKKVMSMPNVKMLLGNHEDMFLEYYHTNSSSVKSLWYSNGGDATDAEFSELSEEELFEIVDYFDNLPLEFKIELNNRKFWLVHGNYLTEREQKSGNLLLYREILLWSRVGIMDTGPKDKTVIFGHTGTYHYLGKAKPFEIWENGNVIGIDCGLAAKPVYGNKSRLGCLRLDDMQRFYV